MSAAIRDLRGSASRQQFAADTGISIGASQKWELKQPPAEIVGIGKLIQYAGEQGRRDVAGLLLRWWKQESAPRGLVGDVFDVCMSLLAVPLFIRQLGKLGPDTITARFVSALRPEFADYVRFLAAAEPDEPVRVRIRDEIQRALAAHDRRTKSQGKRQRGAA